MFEGHRMSDFDDIKDYVTSKIYLSSSETMLLARKTQPDSIAKHKEMACSHGAEQFIIHQRRDDCPVACRFLTSFSGVQTPREARVGRPEDAFLTPSGGPSRCGVAAVTGLHP